VLAEPLPPAIAALLPDDRSVARLILCQHAFKFDPVDDALYAAIAAATAPCRIFVVLREDEPVQSARLLERLKHACSAAGIDGDAVLVPVPWLPTGQFYSLLDAMDVYLDCPGFSGYTTAWQALHRGLPIVTLEGRFMRQRLAAGALRQIGWPDTIATDRQGYVGIATRLVRQCRENPAAALALRAGLGAAAPQLDDDLRVVRAFEDSLVRELEVRRGRTDNGA
jgi:predicted O-linked N-acetylglucosamine transferase (SPINDLY family)